MFRIIFGRGVNLISFFGSLGGFIFWVALNNGAPPGFLVVPFLMTCFFFVLIYRNILFLDFLDHAKTIKGKVISVERGRLSGSGQKSRKCFHVRYSVEGFSQGWQESIMFATNSKYRRPEVADEVMLLENREIAPHLVSEFRLKSMYSLSIDEALEYRALPTRLIYIAMPTLFLVINAIGIYCKYV